MAEHDAPHPDARAALKRWEQRLAAQEITVTEMERQIYLAGYERGAYEAGLWVDEQVTRRVTAAERARREIGLPPLGETVGA